MGDPEYPLLGKENVRLTLSIINPIKKHAFKVKRNKRFFYVIGRSIGDFAKQTRPVVILQLSSEGKLYIASTSRVTKTV